MAIGCGSILSNLPWSWSHSPSNCNSPMSRMAASPAPVSGTSPGEQIPQTTQPNLLFGRDGSLKNVSWYSPGKTSSKEKAPSWFRLHEYRRKLRNAFCPSGDRKKADFLLNQAR